MKLIKKSSGSCIKNSSVKLFSNVRNERVRLPFFLEYYRERGVSEFYIVDNNSSDGTHEYLGEQEDVTLFFTDESFLDSKCGLAWLDQLRDEYSEGGWCITVDCDELLVYPYSEHLDIPALCEYLDSQNYQGLFTLMMDCYADMSIRDYDYKSGENFLNACPYIDSKGYFLTRSDQFPYFGIFGGPRYRGFYKGQVNQQGPTLRKIPLVKWSGDVEYLSVTHSTTPIRLADISGALLHFKYLENFTMHVQSEVARNDRQMSYYKRYLSAIEKKPDLNLFSEVSVKYNSSGQLAELGLIRSSIQYLNWAEDALATKAGFSSSEVWDLRKRSKSENGFNELQENIELSSFMRMWVDTTSPLPSRKSFEVSVIIPVYNAEQYLVRAVKSALNQEEVTEILLIDDGSTDTSIASCQRYAEKHDCVKFLQHPGGVNLGAGATRNLGLEHANCEFVAFLDADDYYLPSRFKKHKLVLLEDESIDAVYGAQSLEFASDELELAREEAKLPMLTTLSSAISPDELFLKMNPIGKKGNFHCNTLTARKNLFERIGGFWDLRTEDIQMWLKMAYDSKLVGVDIKSPISTKFVHDANRMNQVTTREHRPLVFKSLIEYAATKPDQYEKVSKLLTRYFDVLQNLVYRDMDETNRQKASSRNLNEVVSILIFRLNKYQYILEKIGASTQLFSDADLKKVFNEQLVQKLDGLRSNMESLDPADYSGSKNKLEEYFKILSILKNISQDRDTFLASPDDIILNSTISDDLGELVGILIFRIKKYQHLLEEIGTSTKLYSDDNLKQIIDEQLILKLSKLQSSIDSLDPKNYSNSKTELENYFNILSVLKNRDAESLIKLPKIGDQLEQIVVQLGQKIRKYEHALSKISEDTKLFSIAELKRLMDTQQG